MNYLNKSEVSSNRMNPKDFFESIKSGTLSVVLIDGFPDWLIFNFLDKNNVFPYLLLRINGFLGTHADKVTACRNGCFLAIRGFLGKWKSANCKTANYKAPFIGSNYMSHKTFFSFTLCFLMLMSNNLGIPIVNVANYSHFSSLKLEDLG